MSRDWWFPRRASSRATASGGPFAGATCSRLQNWRTGTHGPVEASDNRLPAERIAENESVFRRLNEGIEAATALGTPNATFLCECADPRCRDVIRLMISEYERIRGDNTWFIVAPSHSGEEEARVVEQHRSYHVVAKTGYAAALARASGRSAGEVTNPASVHRRTSASPP
jgi:hypothetical protein